MTFETFDQSDEKTWPDQQKYNDKDKDNDKDNGNDIYVHLENTFKERSLGLFTFEAFDQSVITLNVKKSWPDQQKDN